MQSNKISFKGQRIFIGIDVHAKNWEVAIAPEIGIVRRHSQKPSAKELFDFLKKNYPDGEYQAVYESPDFVNATPVFQSRLKSSSKRGCIAL